MTPRTIPTAPFPRRIQMRMLPATSGFHPFDPHRAAKDIEVGDFYFKKKNSWRGARTLPRSLVLQAQ
jgi:hypothetical protein